MATSHTLPGRVVRISTTAGVQKAPMDEIARGGATMVRRALRGFDRDADAGGKGWNVAGGGRWGLQRGMPLPVWNQ